MLTKIGPIINPKMPPMIKARDCAATHTVLCAGGNQILLRAIVAIYTIALVSAIKKLPMKIQVKLLSKRKTSLSSAPTT